MKNKRSIKEQIRLVAPVLVQSYLPVGFIFFCLGIMKILYDIKPSRFTRDPMQTAGLHPFVGVVSNLGVLCWCSTAAICFFSSAVCRKKNDQIFSRFFLSTAILTTFLLVDDFFQLHDYIFPEQLHIHGELFYIMYGLAVGVFISVFQKTLFETDYVVLLLAFGFLGLSVSVDFVSDFLLIKIPQETFFEDGLKALGIVSWMLYFVRESFQRLAGKEFADDTR